MGKRTKKNFNLFSFVAALLMVASLFSPLSIAAQANTVEGKITGSLLQEFENEDVATFIVEFNEKANTAQVKANANVAGLSAADAELSQRKAVINALQTTAEKTQADVLSYLENNADVEAVKGYFVANVLVVTATQEVAEEVAAFSEVASVTANPEIQLIDEVKKDSQLSEDLPEIGWNVDRVQAPGAWDKGFDGEGIVVASIDSGVQWDHPYLETGYLGYDAETGNVDHSASFFDAINGEEAAYDDNGHGTHVAGTISGSDDIGVAPGAKWIAAKALNSIGSGTGQNFLDAAEWILAPGGDPANAPDVVNNSWGMVAQPDEVDEFFRDVIVAWQDANIFPVFAAGNAIDGVVEPVEGSVMLPALYPEAFTVGATDLNDELAEFSLRGPSAYGEVKPDVAAPGVLVPSALPGDQLGYGDGTSMAAPAVAGLVALGKQVDSDVTIPALKEAITKTATPLTNEEYTETPNNGFGHGLVNASALVDELQAEEPTPDPDPEPEPTPEEIDRIFGHSRYDTAIEISQQGWADDSVDLVIVARGDDYSDALAGVPLAHALDTPILLTPSDRMLDKTLAEIDRLGAEEVLVLGGTGAIAPEAETSLKTAGLSVSRLAGESRFETAAEIAKALTGGEAAEVVVANGMNFPDALAIGSYAAQEGLPILLTLDDRIPAATQEALDSLGVTSSVLVGGEAVISAAVEAELSDETTRLAGDDRYGTNREILVQSGVTDGSELYVATGKDYADALTGAVLAAKDQTAILLVHDRIPAELEAFVTENDLSFSGIFGGQNAVSDAVKEALEAEAAK